MFKLLSPWLLVYLFLPFFGLTFYTYSENHYVLLAQAFINGSFALSEVRPTPSDFAYFNDQYYWPLGPFPAVILMPFVWLFGTNFQEVYLKFPLTVLNFILVYKISKSLNLSPEKSVWLAIFFIFGSVYTPIAAMPSSVYFSQLLTTSLLLLAIYQFTNKKRPYLVGPSIALAILTRATAAFGSLFFFTNFLRKPTHWHKLVNFTLSIIAALTILGAYNYTRFGNLLETGYKYQLSSEEFANRKTAGLFSIKHVPTNLYYMFIKTPDPILTADSHVLKFPFFKFDEYGMSIFFLSPVLFLLFKVNFKNRLVKASSITIIAMLVPILTYAGLGVKQIGYRYALDFLPFLLILLISATRRFSLLTLQILVAVSVISTWFLIIQKLSISNLVQ